MMKKSGGTNKTSGGGGCCFLCLKQTSATKTREAFLVFVLVCVSFSLPPDRYSYILMQQPGRIADTDSGTYMALMHWAALAPVAPHNGST